MHTATNWHHRVPATDIWQMWYDIARHFALAQNILAACFL